MAVVESFPGDYDETWMRPKPYAYFVSWAIVDEDGVAGFGNGEVFCDQPVRSMADVESLEAGLERDMPDATACILNFQLLRGPEA